MMENFLGYIFSHFWPFVGFSVCLYIVINGVIILTTNLFNFLIILIKGYSKTNNYYYLGKEDGTYYRVDPKTLEPIDDNK